MTTTASKNTYRATAVAVGVIYLAGFVVGLTGTGLIQSVLGPQDYLTTVSANSGALSIGAILWLLAVAGDAAHGILLFPILKHYSERIALGYLASRIVDAVFLAIYVLFILLQGAIGSEYHKAVAPTTSSLQALSAVSIQANVSAYTIGMIALGLAGVLLNFLFYRANLVPRWIAVWGLVGYAILVGGMVSDIAGSGLGQTFPSLPGGLWEVFIGGWLIAKGFNPSAFVSQTTSTGNPAEHVAANS
jgi:hypothetical protein